MLKQAATATLEQKAAEYIHNFYKKKKKLKVKTRKKRKPTVLQLVFKVLQIAQNSIMYNC